MRGKVDAEWAESANTEQEPAWVSEQRCAADREFWAAKADEGNWERLAEQDKAKGYDNNR